MKIAVASEEKIVSGHFGHCQNFNIFDVEAGEIIKQASIPNPGHKPGFLPKYLSEQGIDVIIAGGMGGAAVDLFNENDIEVVMGTTGEALNAVTKYLAGELKSTGSVCHEHQNKCH